MRKTVNSRKSLVVSYFVGASLLSGLTNAAEISQPDLPPLAQVERALDEHLMVLNANSGLKMELANQRKWNSGPHEFNLRAGSSQRSIASTGQKLQEWDVALERPLRLFNKASIDNNIGAASVARAKYTLGDARHEAGRSLLRQWFVWQREQAQATLWEQQSDILRQLAQMVEKRVKAGDAPKLELNLAQAAAAQANVSWHQTLLRAQLAGNDLTRSFPAIQLNLNIPPATPQAIEHDFAFWKSRILDDNHELAMVQEHSHVQHLLAQRSRADQLPDPVVGLRYSSESAGNEKVTGVYVSVPFSFGHRNATAEGVQQQAEIAADQEAFVRRRLEGDIYAAHLQATKGFEAWQHAQLAALAIRNNAELVAKAYRLGESSLSDSLTARRFALESSLTETLARLDANETRYRLLLDAHQLWPLDEDDEKTAR
ncbi:MAG: TolC family protein [Gallionella sp.]|nr:TolC family protein [Gallionella sp.]